MTIQIVILLVVCIVFPLALAWRVWRLREDSLSAWLLVAADTAVLLALIALLGRWDMAGYHTRSILFIFMVAAFATSAWRHRSRPWKPDGTSWLPRRMWPTVGSLVIFGAVLVHLAGSALTPEGARDLAFPLREGRFMVGQGGDSFLLNRHAGHPAQAHAADIIEIGPAGFRADGLLPEDLDRYEIYGATVVSPCAAKVSAVEDGHADLLPPRSDPDNPAGNHVILTCGDISVTLAHLRQGSIAVAPGDRVEPGVAVGTVGNSGNTTEPHLHIHAVDAETGSAVPLSFGGRAPLRNRLYVN